MSRNILVVAVVLSVAVSASSCRESAVNEPAAATYSVMFTSAGDRKIAAIKAVRQVTGLGLKEAKDLVDSAPSVVETGVSKERANSTAEVLEQAGMTVKVETE